MTRPPLLSARDRRVEEGLQYTQAFAHRWVFAYHIVNDRVDDVKSDAEYALFLLASEWDAKRGVPWMAFLKGGLRNRFIDQVRSRYGRPKNARDYEGRKAVNNAYELRDSSTHPDGLGFFGEAKDDPGFAEADERLDHCDPEAEVTRLLNGLDARKRHMVHAAIAGQSRVSIAHDHRISGARVSQLLAEVRQDLAAMRAVPNERN